MRQTMTNLLTDPGVPEAIRDNVRYWSQPQNLAALADSPPLHTSYYCVVEGEGAEQDRYRVYAVQWAGADLSKGTLFEPANADSLLQDALRAMSNGQNIGDVILMGEDPVREYRVDCYVKNSPGRRQQTWQASTARSHLEQKLYEPEAWSFTLERSRWYVTVEESSGLVTVTVNPVKREALEENHEPAVSFR
jgi:hypothetical protein